METQQPTRRLCSEIQLFDLCELDECPHKDGRFCTEGRLLEKFEAIKEEDEAEYVAEEVDEDEEDEEGFSADDCEDDDEDY
jgi:hypothetical protein